MRRSSCPLAPACAVGALSGANQKSQVWRLSLAEQRPAPGLMPGRGEVMDLTLSTSSSSSDDEEPLSQRRVTAQVAEDSSSESEDSSDDEQLLAQPGTVSRASARTTNTPAAACRSLQLPPLSGRGQTILKKHFIHLVISKSHKCIPPASARVQVAAGDG